MPHPSTPGPWRLRFNPEFKFIELVGEDDFVVWSFDAEEHGPREEGNARLCRAASLLPPALAELHNIVTGLGRSPREIFLSRQIMSVIERLAAAVDAPIDQVTTVATEEVVSDTTS